MERINMSNIKQIVVEGSMPYNLLSGSPGSKSKRDDIIRFFAEMASPSFGFRIQYFGEFTKPSDAGGEYTFYNFRISGEEAVHFDWLEDVFIEMAKNGTKFTKVQMMDVEYDENPKPFSIIDKINKHYKPAKGEKGNPDIYVGDDDGDGSEDIKEADDHGDVEPEFESYKKSTKKGNPDVKVEWKKQSGPGVQWM